MNLGELITRYRKQAGMTIDELSEKSGVPKGTINKIIAGITKAPTLENVKAIAYALGRRLEDFDESPVDVSRIFSPEEEKHIKKYRLLDLFGKRAVESVLDVEYDRITKIVEPEQKGATSFLRYFDFAVSAGTGEPLDNNGLSQRMSFPTEQVPDDAHYCVRVNGDSMEPAYKDGDIVFVQRLDDSVREGEIGIFVLNGDGYIKLLGHGELLSLNPKYPPIKIHEFDRLECQGRVLGKV